MFSAALLRSPWPPTGDSHKATGLGVFYTLGIQPLGSISPFCPDEELEPGLAATVKPTGKTPTQQLCWVWCSQTCARHSLKHPEVKYSPRSWWGDRGLTGAPAWIWGKSKSSITGPREGAPSRQEQIAFRGKDLWQAPGFHTATCTRSKSNAQYMNVVSYSGHALVKKM